MGKGAGRLLLLRGGATEGQEGRLLGRGNDKLSTLGHIQAQKAAELLMELEVSAYPQGLFPLANRKSSGK